MNEDAGRKSGSGKGGQPEPAIRPRETRLDSAELPARLRKLDPAWQLVDGRLERAFAFPDFRRALEWTRRIGDLAEERDHHPEIVLSYGRVEVRLWTHRAGGLTEKDFDLAAGIDRLRAAA